MAVIDTPKLPPLLFKRNGTYTYVCTYKNKWDSELKRSIRLKNVGKTVGKLVGGGLEGVIEWNDEFLAKFPMLNKLKTERLKDKRKNTTKQAKYYLKFTPVQCDDMEEEFLYVRKNVDTKCVDAGTTWLLDNIVANTPLAKALSRTFNSHFKAQKLLSLAYFKVIEPNSAMYLYEDFANQTRLPFHSPLSISSITRLFQNITTSDIDMFLKTLNKLSIEEEDKDNSNVYYALDSTSISTYSNSLTDACWGHNKDGDNLEQINVMFLVNQKTGCPLYYRYYAGSTPDVSTVSHLLKEYARMGFNRKAILVADRGYSSINNINKLYQNNQSFILNIRTSYSLCKHLIVENLNRLTDINSYDARLDQYVFSTVANWSYPSNCNHNTKYPPKEKAPIHIHMYLDNSIRQKAEYDFMVKLSEIKNIVNGLSEGELSSNDIEFLEKYTYKDNQGNILVNRQSYFEYMLTKGVRILVSDCISDPIEAHRAYRERNEAEVSFSKLKEFVGARRLNLSSNNSLVGKMFVMFLSCSISCMLRSRMRTSQNNEIKLPYDSEVKILRSLASIKQTIFPEGGYFSEVVGKNKQIFDALNIPLPEPELGITYEEDILADEY